MPPLAMAKAHESQPLNHPQIDLEDTNFSFNLVSIGIIVAAIAWAVKLFIGVEKKLDKLENRVNQNTCDIIENKKEEGALFAKLDAKLDSLIILAQDVKSMSLELGHLKHSVEKDLDSRNHTINESRSRIYNLENNIHDLTQTVSILANNLAQGLPSIFGRRGVDHSDPPSNPHKYG